MTPKQTLYARHRAAGLGQAQAALKAGYAKQSAKVIASRMERMPAIQEAIDAARREANGDHADDAPPEFADAESYLLAVVKGQVPPDTVRVGAARAQLPYLNARKRAPLKSKTPRQLNSATENAAASDLNERFRSRVVEIAAARKKGT